MGVYSSLMRAAGPATWQRWLGAIERLNLRFLVHPQHQRAIGRIEIEPDDVGQFGVELRVGAELEFSVRWGLQPMFLPHLMKRRRATTRPSGQAPGAPVIGVAFALLEREA